MSSLSNCSSCAGVVPVAASSCPHCEAPLKKRSLKRLALGVLGGVGASMTLMACYGAPPCDYIPGNLLPDGGREPSRCTFEPVFPDGGTAADGGSTIDAGSDGGADGGVLADGGVDAGP